MSSKVTYRHGSSQIGKCFRTCQKLSLKRPHLVTSLLKKRRNQLRWEVTFHELKIVYVSLHGKYTLNMSNSIKSIEQDPSKNFSTFLNPDQELSTFTWWETETFLFSRLYLLFQGLEGTSPSTLLSTTLLILEHTGTTHRRVSVYVFTNSLEPGNSNSGYSGYPCMFDFFVYDNTSTSTWTLNDLVPKKLVFKIKKGDGSVVVVSISTSSRVWLRVHKNPFLPSSLSVQNENKVPLNKYR